MAQMVFKASKKNESLSWFRLLLLCFGNDMALVEGNGEASGRGLAEKLETLTATTITIAIIPSIFCLSSYFFYYHYCC